MSRVERPYVCCIQVSTAFKVIVIFACGCDIPNMIADKLTMMRTGVDEDVLDDVIAELVASD